MQCISFLAQLKEMMQGHSPEKISAVGAFLEMNHHSIITHLITIDKKALK